LEKCGDDWLYKNTLEVRRLTKILTGMQEEEYIRMQIKDLKEQLTKEIYIILVTLILEKSSGMKMVLLVQIQDKCNLSTKREMDWL
jgi:hypothetical protein